jgi:hypothetical protein
MEQDVFRLYWVTLLISSFILNYNYIISICYDVLYVYIYTIS